MDCDGSLFSQCYFLNRLWENEKYMSTWRDFALQLNSYFCSPGVFPFLYILRFS